MKKRWFYTLLCTFLLLVYIGSILLIYCFDDDKKVVISNNEYRIKEIDEEEKYKIKIYYPISKDKLLDNEVKNIIYDNIRGFKDFIREMDVYENGYYELDINYDEYCYQDYISYVFYIEMDTGGAHPEHLIKTINYDMDKKKIVTIEDLIEIDSDLLNELSKVSREKLLASGKFSGNGYVMEIFDEGTKPTVDNYRNFALTDDGLKIFFDYYQIAPYYMGMSEITILYNEINLSMNKKR